jgi:hypothetical protein
LACPSLSDFPNWDDLTETRKGGLRPAFSFAGAYVADLCQPPDQLLIELGI